MSVHEYKYPQTKDKYIGIEFEFFCLDKNEDDVIEEIENLDLEKYVELADDGSIEAEEEDFSLSEKNNYTYENEYYDSEFDEPEDKYSCDILDNVYSYELKVLCKQSELVSVLSKVGILFKAIGARVNSSCGLHVHLDMRNRDYKLAATRLYNAQSLMMKSVDKKRITNSYCKPIKNKNDLFSMDRYATINTTNVRIDVDEFDYDDNDKKTIEVRIHQGTTDVRDVINWCKFLITTVDTSIADKRLRMPTVYPPRIKNYLMKKMRSVSNG